MTPTRTRRVPEGHGDLLPHHMELLARSAIDPAFAVGLGVRSVKDVDELGDDSLPDLPLPGLRFPWFPLDGEPVWQYRPDVPAMVGDKKLKYIYPTGKPPVLSVVPGMRDRLDKASELVLVEGTKQHLAAVSAAPLDALVVGLAGCWGWSHEARPLPDLARLVTPGAVVKVVFDADLKTNPDVWAAGDRLRETLESLGASAVKFVSVPLGRSGGLDDYLADLPSDRRPEVFKTLLAAAAALTKKPTVARAGRTQNDADRVLEVARERYEFANHQGTPVLVQRAGPNVGHLGDMGISARLAAEFNQSMGRTATRSAIADAVAVLEGECLRLPAQELPCRVTEHAGEIIFDLGQSDGSVVAISPGGWRLLDRSPVPFVQTGLTGALPIPTAVGAVDALQTLLQVEDDDEYSLMLGFLIASIQPSVPKPILAITGSSGSGKSVICAVLAALVDPGPATGAKLDDFVPLTTPSRDPNELAKMMPHRLMNVFDNVSDLTPAQQDVLCRTATGGTLLARKYYTDGSAYVRRYLRPVIVNGVDLGRLQPDLLDRMVVIPRRSADLGERVSEPELCAEFLRIRPDILGGLFSLMAQVLELVPQISMPEPPRMLDFARVLAALDKLRDTDALGLYRRSREDSFADSIEANTVLEALVAFLQEERDWCGTHTELLTELRHSRTPDAGWPSSAKAFSDLIRRHEIPLRKRGVEVVRQPRTGGCRPYRVTFSPPPSAEVERPTVRQAEPFRLGSANQTFTLRRLVSAAHPDDVDEFGRFLAQGGRVGLGLEATVDGRPELGFRLVLTRGDSGWVVDARHTALLLGATAEFVARDLFSVVVPALIMAGWADVARHVADFGHDLRIVAHLDRNAIDDPDLDELVKRHLDLLPVEVALPETLPAPWHRDTALAALANRRDAGLVDAGDFDDAAYERTHFLGARMSELQARGIRVDQPRLASLVAERSERHEELASRVRDDFEVNPASSDEIVQALVEKGASWDSRTVGGRPSTSAVAMEEILAGTEDDEVRELAQAVLDYRQFGSGFEAIAAHVGSDDRIHPQYRVGHTRTGRVSANGPAVQSLSSSATGPRSVLIADEGHSLFSVDLSQYELRIAAALASDPVMIGVFKAGADLHQRTASALFPTRRAAREIGKQVNLSMLYGAAPVSLALQTGLPEKEIRAALALLWSTYHGLAAFKEQLGDLAAKQEPWRSPLGHRYYAADKSRSGHSGEHTLLNYAIQGTGAALFADMLQDLRHKNLWHHVLVVVHDEVVGQAPRDEAADIAEQIATVMSREFQGVPLIANARVGRSSWSSIKAP